MENTAALFIALGDAHRQRILLAFEANERLTIYCSIIQNPHRCYLILH